MTLFSGTLHYVEIFFQAHPEIGVISIIIDMVLFVIQKMADIEIEHQERRVMERLRDE